MEQSSMLASDGLKAHNARWLRLFPIVLSVLAVAVCALCAGTCIFTKIGESNEQVERLSSLEQRVSEFEAQVATLKRMLDSPMTRQKRDTTCSCPPGPPGPKGEPGIRGDPGPTGPKGELPTELKTTKGKKTVEIDGQLVEVQVLHTEKGVLPLLAFEGPRGPPGLRGLPGLRGPPGEKGAAVAAGSPVNEVRQVVPSQVGQKGEKGESCDVSKARGERGQRGESSNRGPRGKKGATGARGLPGVGKIGLPGRPGERGLPGPASERGPKGDKGECIQKVVFENGTFVLVTELDTSMMNLMAAANEGTSSVRGTRDVSGTLKMAPNSNSIVRYLQGPPGPPGAPGEKGYRGDRGPMGIPGQTGPTGRKGEPGPKGDKGDTVESKSRDVKQDGLILQGRKTRQTPQDRKGPKDRKKPGRS